MFIPYCLHILSVSIFLFLLPWTLKHKARHDGTHQLLAATNKSAVTHHTDPAAVICQGLFLFLGTTTGLNISVFPSESPCNLPLMMPLRKKKDRRQKRKLCSRMMGTEHRHQQFPHLSKQGGSTEGGKEASSGEPSECQTN